MSTPPPLPPAAGNVGVNVIIPYKNPFALAAYYLGVFSIIPILGAVLGPCSIVSGILGLRYRRKNPQAGGVVHAWIGIIAGGLSGLGYSTLVIARIISIINYS